MDLLIQMRHFNKVKHRRLKIGEQKIYSTIKENLFLYCCKLSVFVIIVVV